MSLVGPRPTVITNDSTERLAVGSLRAVKPGVLGPWLVHEFWSSGESRDELYYVRNWTIWLDLQILIQVVLSWLHIKRTAPSLRQRLPRPAGAMHGTDDGNEGRHTGGEMRHAA